MSDINPVFYDFEKDMDQVALLVSANADMMADRITLEIQKMIAAGMSQDAVLATLRRDLASGGPIFSGFTSTFKSTAFPIIDNVAQGAVYDRNLGTDEWEWVTTSVEPCQDCEPRHGEVKPYAEWVELGLPRSGFSVCGDYCKCVLVPKGQTGASIADGPVRVTTIAQKRAEFKERLETDPDLKARMEAYRSSLRGR